jgi:hypothetical protein
MYFVRLPGQTHQTIPVQNQQQQQQRQQQQQQQKLHVPVVPPKATPSNVIDIEVLDETTPISQDELTLFRTNMQYLNGVNPKLEPNVEIKPSAITGGGLGLFAARDFNPKERILWAIGDSETYEYIEEHYAQKGQTFRELSTLNGRFYIIPRTEDKWGYINHKYGTGANTQFKEEYFNFAKLGNVPYRINEAAPGSQTISITALVAIKKGQELFIDYGPDYNYEAAGFTRKEKNETKKP